MEGTCAGKFDFKMTMKLEFMLTSQENVYFLQNMISNFVAPFFNVSIQWGFYVLREIHQVCNHAAYVQIILKIANIWIAVLGNGNCISFSVT